MKKQIKPGDLRVVKAYNCIAASGDVFAGLDRNFFWIDLQVGEVIFVLKQVFLDDYNVPGDGAYELLSSHGIVYLLDDMLEQETESFDLLDKIRSQASKTNDCQKSEETTLAAVSVPVTIT